MDKLLLALALVLAAAAGPILAQGPIAGKVAEASGTQQSAPQQPSPPLSANELANQVNNPAAPVTFIQFRDVLLPNIPGTGGVTNVLEVQPVIPIRPSKTIPFLQLIKMTLPIASVPSPVDRNGLGDLQFFDLISIKQSWGRWGFGPALVFPTATSRALGAGKWQAGPSFALIYTKASNWTIGAIFQNPISFAGDSSRPGVNNLIIIPQSPTTFRGTWFQGIGGADGLPVSAITTLPSTGTTAAQGPFRWASSWVECFTSISSRLAFRPKPE
jgi:hypothetical protein